MKLEDQVCSLDLAKRLKELGVKQESWYYWHDHAEPGIYVLSHADNCKSVHANRIISAFMVAELGEMLPHYMQSFQMDESSPTFEKGKWACECANHLSQFSQSVPYAYADTEADARAKMLVYLLKNSLITQQG